MNSIILMGIKHCGKSTQGKLIAKKLDIPFFDTDDIITEMTGSSPRALYSEHGEEEFKKAELNACRWLLENVTQKNLRAVIATGGGICNNSEALTVLRSVGTFVFLQADEKIAAQRIVREVKIAENGSLSGMPAYIAKSNPRTLSDVRTVFHSFYVERTEIYRSIADVCVQMQNVSKKENTQKIIDALK